MEGVLKRKREELAALEKEYEDSKSSTALSTVIAVIAHDNSVKNFKRVQALFSENLKAIDLVDKKHYNWTMTNTLEGGNCDDATVFTVSFKHTPATVVFIYSHSGTGVLKLHMNDEANVKYVIDQYMFNSTIFETLFGTIPFGSAMMQLFFTVLGAVVMRYACELEAKDGRCISSFDLRKIWPSVFVYK